MKTTRMLTILVLALGLASVCSAAEYVWTKRADMPTPRWELSTSAVNGKIYAIGGRPSEGTGSNLSTVEEYDPAADTWTTKADMPTARYILCTSVVDGKIYAIGGYAGQTLSTVEEYDPITNTWTRKADMPTPRAFLTSCVVNGKIYAIGGAPPDVYTGLTTVEVYDPTTDTWTRKADMPIGVWGLCACVVDGKIYALGGRPRYNARPYVQEYDPATDTWTRKGDMLVATSQMASAVLDEKIILIGGWDISRHSPYTTVQMYDPETDIWTREADAPFLRACFSASVVNNRIYAIGGTDRPHPCPATSTVYELTISGLTPDFNGDGIVDSSDMCILLEHWHTDEPSCDIAPPPFGDGIVDVQDLIVLAEHLFTYPGAVAYWKLDETEGSIAYDSVGDKDGTVNGDPNWQPDGGMIDGTLELDGIDDYVSTEFVLNPAVGELSVFAWIKGGAPGQVVISQAYGANWLLADPAEGKLMTWLSRPPHLYGPSPLVSEFVITDEVWHRVGFVWDGSNRILYVDDVEVAKDTQSELVASAAGLYVGAGKNLESGSFFSGLIDDVRIYDRAITP